MPTGNPKPESRNFYISMGAKNTVQPALPIQPGFAQLGKIMMVRLYLMMKKDEKQ